MPYSENIGDGIFELRSIVGNNITRVLYFFMEGNTAILTNGFTKKTQKTPVGEIEKAKNIVLTILFRRAKGVRYMSDFRKYLDEQLKDSEFKKEWEDSECEYDLVKSLVAARKECRMTQKN